MVHSKNGRGPTERREQIDARRRVFFFERSVPGNLACGTPDKHAFPSRSSCFDLPSLAVMSSSYVRRCLSEPGERLVPDIAQRTKILSSTTAAVFTKQTFRTHRLLRSAPVCFLRAHSPAA